MTVVCNAGPLIALGGIRRLDILQRIFTRVVVPTPVVDEALGSGAHGLGVAALQNATWIEVVRVFGSDPLLATSLGAGEASVLLLAREIASAVVLIDELKARRIARDVYSLPVIGTGRVLVEAKRAGVIDSVSELLDAMRTNGYWLSDRIVSEIRVQAGER